MRMLLHNQCRIRRTHWQRATILVLATVVMLMYACSKDNTCGVPHGDGALVDLSLPEMNDLATVGGNLTINRGHKGIFVIRTTAAGDFLAFECACPKDHDTAVLPVDGWDGSILQCPKCHSSFSLYADGTPIEGSATPCSLYQYSTLLLDDGYHLQIY